MTTEATPTRIPGTLRWGLLLALAIVIVLIEIFLGQLLTLVEQNFSAVVADPSRKPAPDK